ncbi:hypothetical protein ACTMU2_28220 [Cupriavidus basilensis]
MLKKATEGIAAAIHAAGLRNAVMVIEAELISCPRSAAGQAATIGIDA